MSGQGLCDCGSGLRAVRCCRFDLSTAGPLPAAAARHLQPLAQRAAEAVERGANAEAEPLCLDVLELAPTHVGALATLYRIRRAQGAARAVEALLRRIVAIDPNDFTATNELTLLLFHQGKLPEAEIHARNAVRIRPAEPQAHNLMGIVLTEQNRPQFGEYHYRRVLELSGRRDPILLANLAWNLKNQGRMAEARALYEESAAAAPDVLQTLLGWAQTEEADRNFPAAADLLERASRVAPANPSVQLTRAVVQGRMERYDAALATLEAMAGADGVALGPGELLEKGRLLDRMGRHGEAFALFAQGKQRLRELTGQAYAAPQADALAARLKGFFTGGRMRLMPRANLAEGPQPVFILGFPRSGTTMVEQTLSAHPAIAAGDELPFINDITGLMPRMLASPLTYPDALADLWLADQRDGLDNLRDYYLQRTRQSGILAPEVAWFTDKMPLNETHLGLISLLFPAAPMIHVLRHPLDVVLSVFSNLLTHGFHCAYALETIARHYVLVMELVEHYRAELTLRYLPIRYEDIVADQAGSVRRMLDFIGAPFDENCLNFHENRRYARTASYAQVAERLYDRSRYRYRAYLEQLAPVIPILEPVIDRLGYRIDR